jgi:RNA polymerase sigma factor (sigma-70 family)
MSAVTATEAALLQGLAQGTDAATERIYKQCYPVIAHWVSVNGGDDADSADLFQEAMLVLWNKARDPRFELSCAIGTYLFSVARRLWLKRLQQRKQSPSALWDDSGADEGPDWAAEEGIAQHEEREVQFNQLETALAQLGEPCASLLKAFYSEGKSMQEIAAEAGYTGADTAKTQKYKCLTRLKKLFFNGQG